LFNIIKNQRRKEAKMKNLNIILIILIFVAGGVGFFGGIKYQESKQSNFLRQFRNGQQNGNNNRATNRNNFRPIGGEITAVDDKSITVKLPDGSSKIVLVPESASINKAAAATKDELKSGTTVMVVGQENSDGSVTAQNIQLNPGNIRIFNNLRPTNTQ